MTTMTTEAADWIWDTVIAPIQALHPKRFSGARPACVCTTNAPACRQCAAGKHNECFEVTAPGWGHRARAAGGDAYIVSRGMVVASVHTPGNSHALHCHCHLAGHPGAQPTQLELF